MSLVQLLLHLDLEMNCVLFNPFVQIIAASLNEGDDEINDFSPLLSMQPLLISHGFLALLLFECGIKDG